MKKLILGLSLITLVVSSCKKNEDAIVGARIFKGPVEKFQHGKAWTWYEEDGKNKPMRMAIAIDDEAMQSLDTNSAETGGHHHNNMVSLKLHPKALITPFKHVGLDWNPHGHEPEFIYGLPHFDFHFYMMSEEDRLAIPPYEIDPTKFDLWPAPQYLPSTYFNAGGGVPQMGCHWVDGTSPELNGQTFTQTFIYGTYNSKVTFYEPMITRAFLQANNGFQRAIPQPLKVQEDGWYPTTFRIAKESGTTNVIMENFIWKQKS